MREQQTNILLPKGEWLDAMLKAFEVANLELKANPRSYEYSFVAQSLPIVFQAIRSKEVPETVYDWDTLANAGFTGTDIAIEQKVDIENKRSWEFPLRQLNPSAPMPKVYLGSTPNLRRQVATPTLADLEGTTIYTEYPRITQKLLTQEKVNARVKSVQGGSEGRWRLDPRNGAVVTIRDTNKTMEANQIKPIQDILSAGVVYLESPNVSIQDLQRIDDLKELVYRSLVATQ